jgi:hypothetical protein
MERTNVRRYQVLDRTASGAGAVSEVSLSARRSIKLLHRHVGQSVEITSVHRDDLRRLIPLGSHGVKIVMHPATAHSSGAGGFQSLQNLGCLQVHEIQIQRQVLHGPGSLLGVLPDREIAAGECGENFRQRMRSGDAAFPVQAKTKIGFNPCRDDCETISVGAH